MLLTELRQSKGLKVKHYIDMSKYIRVDQTPIIRPGADKLGHK